MHIAAAPELRKKRYHRGIGPSIEEADAQPVEREVDGLGATAAVSMDNSSTIDNLDSAVECAVQSFIQKVGEECRSRSS
jgi:hypothetical protein